MYKKYKNERPELHQRAVLYGIKTVFTLYSRLYNRLSSVNGLQMTRRMNRGTGNAGLEKSGLENVGPNRRGSKTGLENTGPKRMGGNRRTGKKTRDQISRGEKGVTGNAGTSCACNM